MSEDYRATAMEKHSTYAGKWSIGWKRELKTASYNVNLVFDQGGDNEGPFIQLARLVKIGSPCGKCRAGVQFVPGATDRPQVEVRPDHRRQNCIAWTTKRRNR